MQKLCERDKNLIRSENYINNNINLCNLVGGFDYKSDLLGIRNFFNFNYNNKIGIYGGARFALYDFLKKLELPQGSFIGLQPFTCPSVVQAVVAAGYKPKFIDINHNFSIDVEDLESKLFSIRALIVTHTFGLPAEIDGIKSVINGTIPVIEDCAHSFLSKYKSKNTGTFFDASFFSFALGKFPVTGNLGVLIINNPEYSFENITSAVYGESIFGLIRYLFYNIMDQKPLYGFFTQHLKILKKNKKIGRLEVKNLNASFQAIHSFAKELHFVNDYLHIQIAFLNELRSLFEVSAFEKSSNIVWNGFMFPVIVEERDVIVQKANRQNIPTGAHFAWSEKWVKQFNYTDDCPNYNKLVKKILVFPIHYKVSSAVFCRIKNFINANRQLITPLGYKR
jgi:dTDP-4-amino-4,6-dideoxygalactose transaminase